MAASFYWLFVAILTFTDTWILSQCSYSYSCLSAKYDGATEMRLDVYSKRFYAYCDTKTLDGGWTIVLSRSTDELSFQNRTKDEWINGFSLSMNETFLGLDKLSALTKSRLHELVFKVDYENETMFFHYDRFQVEPKNEKYRISYLGQFEGDETKDTHDGFSSALECSFRYSETQPGWFAQAASCWHSNIFGEYDGQFENAFCWGSSNYCMPIIGIRMLIRPANPYIKLLK